MLVRQPRELSTRARQAGNQPEANWVGIGDKDDGDRSARFPGSIDLSGSATMQYEDIYFEADQFLRQREVPFHPPSTCRCSMTIVCPSTYPRSRSPCFKPANRLLSYSVEYGDMKPIRHTLSARCPSALAGARMRLKARTSPINGMDTSAGMAGGSLAERHDVRSAPRAKRKEPRASATTPRGSGRRRAGGT